MYYISCSKNVSYFSTEQRLYVVQIYTLQTLQLDVLEVVKLITVTVTVNEDPPVG